MMNSKNAHQIFAGYLLEKIEDELTKRTSDVILYETPEDTVFLGAFSEKNNTNSKENYIFPNNIGMQFKFDKEDIGEKTEVEFHFSCEFYYRVNPTYQEQINYLIQIFLSETETENQHNLNVNYLLFYYFQKYIEQSKIANEKFSPIDLSVLVENINKILFHIENSNVFEASAIDSGLSEEGLVILGEISKNYLFKNISDVGLVFPKKDVALKYKKITIKELEPLKLNITKTYDNPKYVAHAIETYTKNFNNIIFEFITEIRDILTITKKLRIIDILVEENYSRLLADYNIEEIEKPNWEIDLDVDVRDTNKFVIFDVDFSNKSNVNEEKTGYKYPYSTKLYNAKITSITDRKLFKNPNATYSSFDINDLMSSYRYDVKKYGIGINCSVNYHKQDDKHILETNNFAIFEEKRRITREYDDISLKFIDYTSKPIQNLKKILFRMEIEAKSTLDYIQKFKSNSQIYQKAFNDYEKFISEIRRFDFGIHCIELKSDVEKAFTMMNESFAIDSKFDSWRLFQLVFIVSNIPDIIVSEYGEDEMKIIENYRVSDMVDILYYSTGGGKTEAFLGCVIFTLFFDRLRGKNSGLSSIIKYPLRLLSVQQVDRVSKKVAAAQTIKNKYGITGDLFSWGYYVGGRNTLNAVEDYNDLEKEILEDPENYQQIYSCPMCGNEVNIKVDKENKFVTHHCTDNKCSYSKGIPFRFIDDEIYRDVPSILISTLDKFAIMAFNGNFKSLLGIDNNGKSNSYDPVPTLVISDEIHLIKESLGTFSSHYESVFYYFCADLIQHFGAKPKKIKYLGATATISNYEFQVKELYMKDATLFPALSSKKNQDFYSEIDETDISRFNVAVMPFGISPIEYILKIIKTQRYILSQLLNDPTSLSSYFQNQLSVDEITKILFDYYIMIQYSNTKRDANRVRNGVDAYINNSSTIESMYKVPTDTILTGDTKFQLVKKLLSDIEKSTNPVLDNIPNYITATSMISHGIDNDKFNSMYFLGVPNLFAEYIQAYSRVGRKYSGLIFNIIRPVRVREESFLTNFKEFMEYKELMVTPIPISRYSIGALKRTFNGILLSIMQLYVLPNSKTVKKLSSYRDFKELLLETKEKPIAKMMKKIYSHDEHEGSEFNERINSLVKETFTFLRNRDNDKFDRKSISKVIRNMNSTNELPMRSLRDTDNPVNIGLKESSNE